MSTKRFSCWRVDSVVARRLCLVGSIGEGGTFAFIDVTVDAGSLGTVALRPIVGCAVCPGCTLAVADLAVGSGSLGVAPVRPLREGCTLAVADVAVGSGSLGVALRRFALVLL